MSNSSLGLDHSLQEYLLDVSLREHPILRELRQHTATLPEANMQIAPEQGQFLRFLVSLVNAERIVEVGTFTGYSALSMALSLPRHGQLITCDINDTWTQIATSYWRRAKVEDVIELRLGPATETLQELSSSEWAGTVDMVFIDADKVGYTTYYELALDLVRPGGVVAVDNVLWHGSVADPAVRDEETEAIRTLNRTIHADERVDLTMVPIADGLTLARTRRH